VVLLGLTLKFSQSNNRPNTEKVEGRAKKIEGKVGVQVKARAKVEVLKQKQEPG
jgi:hypothetical protein